MTVTLQIVEFTAAHAPRAAQIALQNYEEEYRFVPTLPQVNEIPDLLPLAENGLGVVALEGNDMVGFLCGIGPFNNAFRSTDAIGVFSPMGGNGAVGENRAKIYARMYQAAGAKWANAGAASHAVCVYAHDKEVQEQFFRYGFGLRCIDAVREMTPIPCTPCEGHEFLELEKDEYPKVFPLDLLLNEYQSTSPYFLSRKPDTLESFIDSYTENAERFFAAKYRGDLCAYLMAASGGDTFIADDQGYIDIGGAFCLPEHRGKGVYQNLLNLAVAVLSMDGYTRLDVDFESINPAAYGFWLKYFSAYAHSVVRRIDEHAVTKRSNGQI